MSKHQLLYLEVLKLLTARLANVNRHHDFNELGVSGCE